MENGGHSVQELRLQVPGTNDQNCVHWDDDMFNVIPGSDLPIEVPEVPCEAQIPEFSMPAEVPIQDPPSMVYGETSVIAAINQENQETSSYIFPLFSTGVRVPKLFDQDLLPPSHEVPIKAENLLVYQPFGSLRSDLNRFAESKPAAKYSFTSCSGGMPKNFGAGRNSKAGARKSLAHNTKPNKEYLLRKSIMKSLKPVLVKEAKKAVEAMMTTTVEAVMNALCDYEGCDERYYGGCDKKI